MADAGWVLVTGTSAGIGRACALHLAARGFGVLAGVRRPADGDSLVAEAQGRLEPVLLDVTDASSVESAAKQAARTAGPDGLRGLVNNAGIYLSGPLEVVDLDELRRQLEVNVVGQVAVTQALLPMLRRSTGRIVMMGSMFGFAALPSTGPYAASKFALEGVSDLFRRELRPWNIKVVLLEPGRIQSDVWRRGRLYHDEQVARLSEEGRALYGASLDRTRSLADVGEAQARPADTVARAVHRALTSRRPRARYRVGLDASALWVLARWLPDSVADALFTLPFR